MIKPTTRLATQVLSSWYRTSFSTYVYKYSTKCNNIVLVLLQDHSTCFEQSPRPSSGVQQLQLTVTGITYLTFDREFCGKVHFKICPKSGG
jgi:hypothetical protein